jgi:hypothetical protein
MDSTQNIWGSVKTSVEVARLYITLIQLTHNSNKSYCLFGNKHPDFSDETIVG